MSHDALQASLAAHLRGVSDRMVWTNMQLGPVGSPRPDVYTVDKSFSKFAADAYEVKVSVSDLRKDVTSGKWQSYRKYAHRVWFAFDNGLVPFEIVPVEAGIIVRSEAGLWRARRKPVAQVMDSLPRDTWMKLLLACHPMHPVQPLLANEWKAKESIRKKLGKESAELFSLREKAKVDYALATERLERSAKEIEAEVKRKREWALAEFQEQERRLSQAQSELADALGLGAGERTLTELRWRLARLANDLNGRGLSDAIVLLQRLHAFLPQKERTAA